MTNNNESKPLEEPSKPSSAPVLRDQKTDLDDLLTEVPTEVLETFEKLLQQAEADPAQLSLFQAKLKWSRSRHEFLPAEIIEEYERAIPGSGKWLLDRVEAQIAHRQTLENLQVSRWENRADKAQRNSLFIALSGIVGALLLAGLTGHWLVPTITLAICVGGPIGVQITRIVAKWIGPDQK